MQLSKALLVALLIMFAKVGLAQSSDRPLAAELDKKAQESSAKTPPQVKAVMDKAIDDLRRSEVLKTAAGVGTKFPDATLRDSGGKPVKLSSLMAGGPTIVTFYRGGWCPYCNIQLHMYQTAMPEFMKHGAKVVAISPETPDQTATTAGKDGVTFTLLSDADNAFSSQMGLVYKLPDDLKALYLKFGIDLAKSQGNPAWRLPLAATFVVDRNGVIIWRFVDVDYKHRAEPADIVNALTKSGA